MDSSDKDGNYQVAQFRNDSIKAFGVYAPLLASTMAISFDVGYFSGLGISYFTIFSLTEHLLFAIEALPIAMLVAAIVIGFFVYTQFLLSKNARELASFNDKIKGMGLPELREELNSLRASLRKKWWKEIIFYVVVAGWLAWTLYFAYFGMIVLFAYIYFAAMYLIKSERSQLHTLTMALASAAMPMVCSFAFGFQTAMVFKRIDTPNAFLVQKMNEIPARIVRSGEKGVLFLSLDSKTVRFLKWDAVTELRTPY